MGDVVNLKRFKKRTSRAEASAQADANRIKYGRTKTERTLDERNSTDSSRILDQHRISHEDTE